MIQNFIRTSLIFSIALLAGCSSKKSDITSGYDFQSSAEAAPANRISKLLEVKSETPEGVSLQWLQEFLEENNPELRELRAEIKAAEGRRLESGLYPNPSLGISQKNETINDHSPISEQTEVVISQPIVINNRLGIAKKLQREKVEVARQQYEKRRQILQWEMRDLHDKALFHKSHEAIAWDLLAIVEQEISDARAENDRERLQIIWEELSLEITIIAAELAFTMQNLETYLGVPVELNSSQLTTPLDDSLNYDYQRALLPGIIEDTPEYKSDLAELTAREYDHKLSKRTVIPDVDIMVGGGYRYAYDESFFSVGLEIPLPIFDRNQGKILETEALIEAQEAAIDRTNLNQLIEIKNLKQLANEVGTTYDVYRYEIVPRSRETFKKVSNEYRQNNSTIHDLLSSLMTLIQNERLLVTYQKNLNTVNSHAARLIGLPKPVVEIP